MLITVAGSGFHEWGKWKRMRTAIRNYLLALSRDIIQFPTNVSCSYMHKDLERLPQ